LVEVVKVDPSMAKDTQTGVEDLSKETLVANEVDLVGPQDSKLQLPDLVISSTGNVGEIYPVIETDQFIRNYKHCCAASYCCCRSF